MFRIGRLLMFALLWFCYKLVLPNNVQACSQGTSSFVSGCNSYPENACFNVGGFYSWCTKQSGTFFGGPACQYSCVTWTPDCGTCGSGGGGPTYQCGSRQPEVSINNGPWSTANPQYVSFGDTIRVRTSPTQGTGLHLMNHNGLVGQEVCNRIDTSLTLNEPWWGSPGDNITAGAYDYQQECWIGAECQGQISLHINECIAPDAATLLTPTNGGEKELGESLVWAAPISWGANCSIDKYKIFISSTPTFSGTPTATLDIGTNSYYFAGNPGQTYYWKVRTTNYVDGPDSPTWSFVVHAPSWWQGTGGGAYGGTGINADVPVNIPADEQFLILDGASGNAGLVYSKSGTISVGTNTDAGISNSGYNVAGSGYSGDRQDYTYFLAKMGIYDKTVWDGNGKPSYNPGSNQHQIFTHTGNVTINFNPSAGQKMIFLIDGNVTVDTDIDVPETAGSPSFLAVIANGTIAFANNVGSAEGWWVGNSIDIETTGDQATDKQFVGEGSFVGFDSIIFRRDRGLTNTTEPTEKFIYRPDMMVNAPIPLQNSYYIWKQGTP